MDFLRKYFIPHKDNDYKPDLWRDASLVAIFSITIVLFIVALSGQIILKGTDLTALVLPKVLVDYANDDRSALSYGTLKINSILEKAAQLKANDMASRGYFAHDSPDGHSPWYWFDQVGYNYSYAGENLAVNFSDSVEVNQAWMNSPGHRDNILNNNFSEIGIATAEGIYQGRPTTFVVQLFGRPTEKITSLIKTAQAQTSTSTMTTTSIIPKITKSTKNNIVRNTASTSIVLSKVITPVVKNSISDKSPEKHSTFLEKVLLSPKMSLSFAYLILSVIIIIGLVLMIFVEIKKQHPRLILLGLGLLFIISGLLYVYQSVLFDPLVVV